MITETRAQWLARLPKSAQAEINYLADRVNVLADLLTEEKQINGSLRKTITGLYAEINDLRATSPQNWVQLR